MIGIIAALSPEAVIGVDGNIPWHYPADMKRFKRLTVGSTIIMGRLTWESLPRRPLPRRRNIVISGRPDSIVGPGVDSFPDIESALADCKGDVWFIGGARIYRAAMACADVMDLTYVPDRIDAPGAVYFPERDRDVWEAGPLETHPDDDRLKHRVFRKRRKPQEPAAASGS